MENRYTATVYNNDHVIDSQKGNDLSALMASMLVRLDDSNTGSYGTITDNSKGGAIIQQFKKSVIDD